MRKLILIAAIALITATPCHANLSLATAETPPAATEQPQATAEARPVAAGRSPMRISRRRHSHWNASRLSYHYFGYHNFSYRYFRGGC